MAIQTNPILALLEKIAGEAYQPDVASYAAGILRYLTTHDPEEWRKLPAPPQAYYRYELASELRKAPTWSETEESLLGFMCELAMNNKSPNPELYNHLMLRVIESMHPRGKQEESQNATHLTRLLVETGFAPSEIIALYSKAIVRITVFANENQSIGNHTGVPSMRTAFDDYLWNLPDGDVMAALDALPGNHFFLEALARHRLPLVRLWFTKQSVTKGLVSFLPLQMQALIRGSETFDADALRYIRLSSKPGPKAMVVWQLARLRPETYRALRDEYYQKPEIAADTDVMKDLCESHPRQAVKLLEQVLKSCMYVHHDSTSPLAYRHAYCLAAKQWDQEAKDMFVALVKTEHAFGIQAALEEIVIHAPSDADEDFDKLLKSMCFCEAVEVMDFDGPMVRLVAEKRPGRMIQGWWDILDGGSKEGRELAVVALIKGLGENAVSGAKSRLRSKQPDIRIGAASLLAELGGDPAISLLQGALQKEETDKVRAAIFAALRRNGALPQSQPVDSARVLKVLENLEAGFVKKLTKGKLPPGEWWKISDSIAPKATDGSAISANALAYLVLENAKLKTIETAPDTLQLIACLNKRSAADFALALLNAWLAEGQDAKHRWVLALTGTLGDSRIISTLLPWIPKWCEAARHKLAEYAAQGISLLGSNEALMVLDTLASRYRSKFRNVGAAAAAAFQSAAQARGISPDELGDLVVPSFDFNEDGQRRFEWDGSAALAELTMDLKLEWSDPDSEKSWKTLPASAPDAVKAEVKELGKLLRETGKAQALRLEQALVKQRRWPVAAWQELYEKHPLLRAYATRLVWGVYDAAGTFQRAFRRYPNGILADAAGAMEELPESDARIGLLHPLELDAATLTAWQAHLARFKVQPPFPQLDRPVERLEPNLHNRRTLAIAEGREISYGTFRSRAEKRGWVRGSVVDAGGISSYYKIFPGASVEVSVETGGMFVGMDPMDTLTLGPARFCTAGSIQRGSYVYDEPAENDPRLLTFGQVPPVVYSETVSDLKAIIARKEEE